MYRDYDGDERELSDSELDLLDSVLRLFPGEGDILTKLDKYIAYEGKRGQESSDGKWHRELFAELEALRGKLRGGNRQAGAGVDWDLVDKLMEK